jgi:streptogramin lyase
MRAALVALLAAGLLAACGNNAPLSSPLVRGPAGGAGGAAVSTGGAGGTITPGVSTPRVEVFTGTFVVPRGIAVQDDSRAWVTDESTALVRLDLQKRAASTVHWKAMVVYPPAGVMMWNGAIYATQGCSFERFMPATATVDFLSDASGPGGCIPMGVPGLYGLVTDGMMLYWAYPDSIPMAIFGHVMATLETSPDYRIVAGTLDPSSLGGQDGEGTTTKLDIPRGLALGDPDTLYFADELNHAIRRVHLSTGSTETVAGALGLSGDDDGPLAMARFNSPQGLAFDGRDALYVADHDNGLVRRVSLTTGMVSTVAGVAGNFAVVAGPTPTPIGHPMGLALTPAGDVLVASDSENAVLMVHLP